MSPIKAKEVTHLVHTGQRVWEADRTRRQAAWHEKALARMAERKKRGGISGPAPLGYHSIEENGRCRLVKDPEKAHLVSELWPLALKYSIGALQEIITRKGLLSRHGIPLSPQAIRVILRNPIYLGGPHEALVDRETFKRVQRKIA